MTPLSWRLLGLLSRLLEPDDRDAVLGDFAESNLPARTAFCDLLGLIARRQADSWKRWRPWLALFGIVGPVSLMLFLFLLRRSVESARSSSTSRPSGWSRAARPSRSGSGT